MIGFKNPEMEKHILNLVEQRAFHRDMNTLVYFFEKNEHDEDVYLSTFWIEIVIQRSRKGDFYFDYKSCEESDHRADYFDYVKGARVESLRLIDALRLHYYH